MTRPSSQSDQRSSRCPPTRMRYVSTIATSQLAASAIAGGTGYRRWPPTSGLGRTTATGMLMGRAVVATPCDRTDAMAGAVSIDRGTAHRVIGITQIGRAHV